MIIHAQLKTPGSSHSINVAGNFICDIMLKATEADFAMINSGTLRSDCIHPKGQFKVKDLFAILPMIDPLVVLKIKGTHSPIH